MKDCGVYKHHRGFYDLQYTFQTVVEEAGETATRFLMGHVDNSMDGVYRESLEAGSRINDVRSRFTRSAKPQLGLNKRRPPLHVSPSHQPSRAR